MAKRFIKGSIPWKMLAERVSFDDKPKLNMLRAKYELLLLQCTDYPIEPPKIDWNYFSQQIIVPGMVEEFKQKYEALKVPYPGETVSEKLNQKEKEVNEYIALAKKESEDRIIDLNKKLEQIANLVPYDQMTMDDFRDAFPNLAVDTFNNPTFWPHLPEDQIGHEERMAMEEARAREQELTAIAAKEERKKALKAKIK